jgi:prevent-host-death family protein
VKDLSATDAARRFSEVLDSVEHRNESYRVIRAGRPIARITPVGHANGAIIVDFLTRHQPDPGWLDDLRSVRELLRDEAPAWPA